MTDCQQPQPIPVRVPVVPDYRAVLDALAADPDSADLAELRAALREMTEGKRMEDTD